jgi:hypothetical protein
MIIINKATQAKVKEGKHTMKELCRHELFHHHGEPSLQLRLGQRLGLLKDEHVDCILTSMDFALDVVQDHWPVLTKPIVDTALRMLVDAPIKRSVLSKSVHAFTQSGSLVVGNKGVVVCHDYGEKQKMFGLG